MGTWGIMKEIIIGVVSVAVLAFGFVPAGASSGHVANQKISLQVLAPAPQD